MVVCNFKTLGNLGVAVTFKFICLKLLLGHEGLPAIHHPLPAFLGLRLPEDELLDEDEELLELELEVVEPLLEEELEELLELELEVLDPLLEEELEELEELLLEVVIQIGILHWWVELLWQQGTLFKHWKVSWIEQSGTFPDEQNTPLEQAGIMQLGTLQAKVELWWQQGIASKHLKVSFELQSEIKPEVQNTPLVHVGDTQFGILHWFVELFKQQGKLPIPPMHLNGSVIWLQSGIKPEVQNAPLEQAGVIQIGDLHTCVTSLWQQAILFIHWKVSWTVQSGTKPPVHNIPFVQVAGKPELVDEEVLPLEDEVLLEQKITKSRLQSSPKPNGLQHSIIGEVETKHLGV